MNHLIQINELLGKTVFLKILLFFLENPTSKLSQVELRKKIKLAKATATKWLGQMEAHHLVEVEKSGLTKFYYLNRKNQIIKQLKILHNLLSLAKIKEIAAKFGVKAYLYGSAARGEDVENSDIDILMIGRLKREQIIQEINNIISKTKRRIKVEVFSQIEWSQMARKDPAFYERVEKDKIEL